MSERDPMLQKDRCFACDRRLGARPSLADTRDGQIVFVGIECFKLVKQAGENGYQPPKGGPRLYVMDAKAEREYREKWILL